MRSFLLVIILGICLNGYSQSNVKLDSIAKLKRETPLTSKQYLRFSLGYRFFAGLGGVYSSTQGPGTSKLKIIGVSNGTGLPISFGFGTYLQKGLIFEFDFTYKLGRTKPIVNTFYNEVDFSTIEQSNVYIFNEVQFSPRLINEIRIKKSFIQLKVGPLISLGKERLEINENFTSQSGYKATGQFEWETTIKPGVGFIGALGVRGQIDDGVSVFADLSFIQLSCLWDGSKRTMAVINNQNIMDDYSESDKVQIPVSELDGTVTLDPDKPTQVLQTRRNYNSIGFNIGIIRHF